MGAGASAGLNTAVAAASEDELKAALASLSAPTRNKLAEALNADQSVVGAVELVATEGFVMKEFFGNFSTQDGKISATYENFKEPEDPVWRCSEFTEYIVMLAGELNVEHNGGEVVVKAGAGVCLPAGCRLRVKSPKPAELMSICLPAIGETNFHPEMDPEAPAPAHATSATPTLVDAVEVVKAPDLTITEFFGNVASKDSKFSACVAKVEKACSEAWQKPEFAEWVLVLKGTLHLERADGVTKIPADSGVFLAAGERVKCVWPEPCTYVSICMPAFTPEGCRREPEEGSAKDADPQTMANLNALHENAKDQ